MSPRRERAIHLRHEDAVLVNSVPPALIASAADPIDRAHLGRYTLGSPALEREIIGLFLAQLPLSVEQLRFAATDREWQIAAHTIKGSARSVGAWQVSRLALEAEKIPGIDDEDERARILAALEEALETIQSYAEDVFPSTAPRA